MYLDHYHLKVKPFNLSPGPEFLWLGEKHKEALATLDYGIQDDLGFLLLSGDVGVGKTALIHHLINNLDSSTIVAHITDPGLGTIDFFKVLAVEFNIPVEFHGKGEFLIELEKFLYAAHSDHKKVLLIVDEAQRLNNKLLDQIRVLSNIELSDRKLINIFFVGQPEFKNMLMANNNRAIRQRIAINYHIYPLTVSETGQYIEHRLKVAGATQKIFKPDAIREIFRFTGGFPRAINILCDHALLTGYASGIKSVNSAVIEECEQELNIRAGFDYKKTSFQTSTDATQPETGTLPPPRPKSSAYPMLIGLFVVLAALTSYLLLWPEPRSTMTPNTSNKLANASSQPTDTVVEEPQRINEKTQKEPIQTSSKNEIQPANPDKVNETQGKSAPVDQTASADRPPAIFKAQANPAPDPLPYISEVNNGVTVPGKAGADASVFADLAPRKDSGAQEARPAQEADPDTWGQAKVPGAEAASEPDPSTGTPTFEDPVSAAGKAAAAMVAVLAAEPGPTMDPAPWKETVVQDSPPARAVDTGADRQAAEPAANAAPKADSTTDRPAVDSSVTAAGKTAADAAAVAVPTAKPKPKVDQAPRKKTVAQEAPPARKLDADADGQTAITTAKAEPEPDLSPDTAGVESDATTPGKAAADAAVLAVLAAKPSSPVKPVISVDNASVKSGANALKPGDTRSSGIIESESKAKSPSSTPKADESSKKAASNNQNQAKKKTQPEQGSPVNPPEPPITAKTETQLQPSSKQKGATVPSVEKPEKNDLESRLRSFLQNYSNTYAAKDFDAFTNLFIPDARENGAPFIRLLPKYKKNFELIEAIEYRIELQQFTYDEDMGIVKVDGYFFLKWLPPDKKWRENAGKISMSLQEKGPSFLVRQLDYQGGSTKTK